MHYCFNELVFFFVVYCWASLVLFLLLFFSRFFFAVLCKQKITQQTTNSKCIVVFSVLSLGNTHGHFFLQTRWVDTLILNWYRVAVVPAHSSFIDIHYYICVASLNGISQRIIFSGIVNFRDIFCMCWFHVIHHRMNDERFSTRPYIIARQKLVGWHLKLKQKTVNILVFGRWDGNHKTENSSRNMVKFSYCNQI